MLVRIQTHTDAAQLQELALLLQNQQIRMERCEGDPTLLLLSGDTWMLDAALLRALPFVVDVQRTESVCPLASRDRHRENTVISVGGAAFGRDFVIIAGPCAVESEEQIRAAARAVKQAGGQVLRGGAFKPRTSPYVFQGLGAKGIRLLVQAGREAGLPVVTEITDPSQLPLFDEVDILQVGARNMQNYELLRCLGKTDKPILLKRGLSATLTEFLLSAEYLLKEGNNRVILCERGIRTFETETRATLDVAAIPLLKKATHLPVIVDPSHAAGHAFLVPPLALASAAAGAGGLMVEMHPQPQNARSDAPQALSGEVLALLSRQVRAILPCLP